ncbi:hypothetical protein FWP33_17045 [Vibrio parahaemolyticus]|nr:hypothetical protein [Vibrio parahaemolyticus]
MMMRNRINSLSGRHYLKIYLLPLSVSLVACQPQTKTYSHEPMIDKLIDVSYICQPVNYGAKLNHKVSRNTFINLDEQVLITFSYKYNGDGSWDLNGETEDKQTSFSGQLRRKDQGDEYYMLLEEVTLNGQKKYFTYVSYPCS